MLYEPTICTEIQRTFQLISSDPVLYAWVYWEQEDAREQLGKPFEIRRKDSTFDFSPLEWRFWARMRYTDNPPPTLPFVGLT